MEKKGGIMIVVKKAMAGEKPEDMEMDEEMQGEEMESEGEGEGEGLCCPECGCKLKVSKA